MLSDPLTGYPAAVRAQITDLVDILTALLGQNLAGIHLAGTATARPDNDEPPILQLLVLTQRDLLRAAKLGLLQALLRRSRHPAVLELLVLRHADLLAIEPALPFQLHFTEGSRPQFTADTASLMWLSWPDGASGSLDRNTLLRRLQPSCLALVGPALPSLSAAPASLQPITNATLRPSPLSAELPFQSQQLPFGEEQPR